MHKHQERKFHSRVLSFRSTVSSAHFHMIVQKILQLCKEMNFHWCAGIPNEATTADGKTMRTTNHFQSHSHPREKIVKIAILDHVHTALSSI